MSKGGADLVPMGNPLNLRKFLKLPEKCFHSQRGDNSPNASGLKPLSIPKNLALSPSPVKSEVVPEVSVEKAAVGEEGPPTPLRPPTHDDSIESFNREFANMKEDSIKAKILTKFVFARQCLRSYKSFKRKLFFIDWTLNNWFENIIYIFIFGSMVMLVLDNPQRDPESTIAVKIAFIDRIITIIFALEAICRIIA